VPLHWLEATVGHLRREDLQRLRIGKASRQRLGNQAGIDARPLGQGHDFGNDQCIAGDNHLIAGLDHLPCANTAHMGDALADAQQRRSDSLKVCHRAADHDRQGARLSPHDTTRHRRIQPMHATCFVQYSSHFPGGRRLQAGKIHQQLARLRALGDARCTKYHLAYHSSIGQAKHDHIRVRAQLRGARYLARPGLDQWRALARIAIPHGQWKTGSQQSLAHRQAHEANSGESQGR